MGFFKFWLLPLIPFFVGFHAFAVVSMDQCKDPKIAKDFGPVRDQQNAGICFAATAADLIGYHQHLKSPQQVSLYDTILTYLTVSPAEVEKKALPEAQNNPVQTKWIEENGVPNLIRAQAMAKKSTDVWAKFNVGGDISGALLTYKAAGGICLESRSPSQAKPGMPTDVFLETQIEHGVARVALHATLCGDKSFQAQTNFLEFSDKINEIALKRIKTEDDLDCGERTPLKPYTVNEVDMDSESKRLGLTKGIAQALSLKTPVGLILDANFFKQGDAVPVGPGNHAGTIIGMKWDPVQGCEFEFRNSWGTSCAPYAEDVKKRCDGQGNLWLTEDEISSRATKAYTLNP